MLDKVTLRQNWREMVATNIPSWRRVYLTTSGTTGAPIKVWNSPEAVWRERAFIDAQWKRVGFHIGELRAVLRGGALKVARHWQFDPKARAYNFSTYHMTPENVINYARIMKTKGISFLHAYPSSALNFARLLNEAGGTTPRFRAVLLGSENLYPGQREQLERFYDCRVYSWYGHTESLVLAGECEESTDYHVFPDYGFFELLSDDGENVQYGQTGEIVGTSLHNFVMPLVRYRTADYAEAGAHLCGCGRKCRLIRNVRGRWMQEMLVGKFDNLISITSINFHSDVFDRVLQFQFYQREKGKVQLRLVRDHGYTDADTNQIRKELLGKIGDSMELTIVFTDVIPVTDRGKFRFVIQHVGTAAPSFSEVI
jgi:phenylacetate-CoA ligase